MVSDVAVVGGGVAGAAVCVALSRRGVRPLWIAPDTQNDRDPVGESLAPAAGPILASLGLGHLLKSPRHRRANTTFSAWGGARLMERNAIVHLEGPSLVLDRRAFEADLTAAALAVSDRRAAALVSAEAAEGAWSLTFGDSGRAAARFVVDATGRAAVFGREVSSYVRSDQLVAATALLPHRDPDVEPTPATLIEAVEDGWLYAALLPDGRLSVAYFSDPDLLPANLSRDLAAWRRVLASTLHVGRWIEDAGFAIEAPPRLTSAGVTRLEPPAGEVSGCGWAAVGDAAAAFDPLSSHGLTTALWTAARVGGVAADWLGGDGCAMEPYAQAVVEGVENFMIQRAALYARETRFADAPFWRRRVAASPLQKAVSQG